TLQLVRWRWENEAGLEGKKNEKGSRRSSWGVLDAAFGLRQTLPPGCLLWIQLESIPEGRTLADCVRLPWIVRDGWFLPGLHDDPHRLEPCSVALVGLARSPARNSGGGDSGLIQRPRETMGNDMGMSFTPARLSCRTSCQAP